MPRERMRTATSARNESGMFTSNRHATFRASFVTSIENVSRCAVKWRFATVFEFSEVRVIFYLEISTPQH